MRLLLIEDDRKLASTLEGRLRRALPGASIVLTEAFDEAAQQINMETFDAAIIDLRLPSTRGSSDHSVQFGVDLDRMVDDQQPGCLRIFLTASDALVVKDQMRFGRSGDLLRDGITIGMVDYIGKGSLEDLDECVDRVVAFAAGLESLDGVVLEPDTVIDPDIRRALCLTVRYMGASTGLVTHTSGYSGSTTALVVGRDESGGGIGRAFCKWGRREKIEREVQGHKRAQVSLSSAVLPHLAERLEVGVGRGGALIFTQAPADQDFFTVVGADPAHAGELVAEVESALAEWPKAGHSVTVDLGAYVSADLTPTTRSRFPGEIGRLGLTDFDGIDVQLIAHCHHGDLHGSNIFVTDAGSPFFIDFEFTDDAAGPVDQVSLPLSLTFHGDSPFEHCASDDALDLWWDTSSNLPSPLAEIRAASDAWARRAGHDELALVAATLRYSLWMAGLPNRGPAALRLAAATSAHLRSMLGIT